MMAEVVEWQTDLDEADSTAVGQEQAVASTEQRAEGLVALAAARHKWALAAQMSWELVAV